MSERPIDQLRRLDTAVQLLEEDREDYSLVNHRLEKLEEGLRELRERARTNDRIWLLGWQATRVATRWILYIAAAAGGWAWSHWSTIEAAIHPPTDPK